MMATDVLERLDSFDRHFAHALVLGSNEYVELALSARAITASIIDPSARRALLAMDEDRLAIGDARFDLVIAIGSLDTVSDLPGALILIRRLLQPDGLMLAAFGGAPSLTALRSAIAIADGTDSHAIARLHPQIDVRAAGDLLVRAGFSRPVADVTTHDVAYASLSQLIADLRAAGATNVLAKRHGVTRSWLAAASAAFAALADDSGSTHETLSFITLTGWATSKDSRQAGDPRVASQAL